MFKVGVRQAVTFAIVTFLMASPMLASEASVRGTHASAHHASRLYHHRRRHHHHHHLLPVSADAPTAELVFDAETGRVLSVSHPDQLVYPASLTKMMTLYLTFRAMDQGWVRPDSIMQVSEFAASASPTKLGLHEGQEVRVDDLISGAVTESANDAARTLAENLDRNSGADLARLLRADMAAAQAQDDADAAADPPDANDAADREAERNQMNDLANSIRSDGSEEDFARLMTLQARLLGMDDTTFRNATGLPDENQVTTAPDMALLAYAIVHLKSQYYAYFSLPRFNFAGVEHRNHNLSFLASYDGADGIKTGYTERGGFNVADSALRGNQRLIAIVMGRQSHAARDAEVRALLDAGFAQDQIQTNAPSASSGVAVGATLDLPDLTRSASGLGAQTSAPAASDVRASAGAAGAYGAPALR
jgi:D-alanyl-D-alanine carboxypeptidase